MINALSAANAYSKQLKLAGDATEESGGASGVDFGKLVQDQLQDFVGSQNKAEAAKLEALSGKGDIADLVTAIANAELALNTIVTIRDKAINAYQDIIRMPI